MKSSFNLVSLVILASTAVLFQSCVRDRCVRESTFTKYSPVYMSYDDMRAAVASEAPSALRQPGKIYFIGSTVLINEFDKGIHVIDNSDPSNPQNVAFINIPGNVDMAVRNNVLYADSYIDLVAIDISNPNTVAEVGRVQDVFPYRVYNGDFTGDETQGVIVDWLEEVVTEETDCQMSYGWWGEGDVLMFANDASGGIKNTGGPVATGFSPPTGGNREMPGLGGSMARFTLSDAYLYTVDNSDMHVFSIANLHQPTETSSDQIGFNIETIWTYGLNLFIGSQAGMHIYSIATPGQPVFVSKYEHITSCDPVIISGSYAYVTLRSGTPCSGWTDQLELVDITDMSNPVHYATYPMFNPHGLGIDDDLLFICDGDQGLKVFNCSDPDHIDDNIIITYPAINAFDVIPYGGVAMMIGTDGFYQYDYTDINNIHLLSVIPVEGI